jgi:predicted RNA-binding Zn-ribbon protein involved in translation (DUF1610 family)
MYRRKYLSAIIFVSMMGVAFALMPIWMSYIFVRYFGDFGFAIGGCSWLMLWIIAYWKYICPNCGTSMFLYKSRALSIVMPWPQRQCGTCGMRS